VEYNVQNALLHGISLFCGGDENIKYKGVAKIWQITQRRIVSRVSDLQIFSASFFRDDAATVALHCEVFAQ